MKNICKVFLYGVLAFFMLPISCKKEKEQDPITILTTKAWRYSSVDRTPGNNLDLLFNMVSECEKDDVFEFKNDGKLITYNKENKCFAGEPESKISTYSYNNQTKELTIGSVKCAVISLTKDQLKYRAPVSYHTGVVYAIIILE